MLNLQCCQTDVADKNVKMLGAKFRDRVNNTLL